jgi:hypothetical protein
MFHPGDASLRGLSPLPLPAERIEEQRQRGSDQGAEPTLRRAGHYSAQLSAAPDAIDRFGGGTSPAARHQYAHTCLY